MRERQEPKALRRQRPYPREHTTVRVGNSREDDANRSPPSNHEKEQKHMSANELTTLDVLAVQQAIRNNITRIFASVHTLAVLAILLISSNPLTNGSILPII